MVQYPAFPNLIEELVSYLLKSANKTIFLFEASKLSRTPTDLVAPAGGRMPVFVGFKVAIV